MANNKNPNQKQAGEKEPGKDHYNPGNMSSKTIEVCKDESEQQDQKQAGEKEPGKDDYNPGNMSGKTIEICKDESEQQAHADRIRSRHEQQDQKR